MSSRRPSSRAPAPAQRRPRTDRACNYCRRARQRCEPSEYGTNDRPCRRCVVLGLECSLSRATRSQSPNASASLGSQGPEPAPNPGPQSAGGAPEERVVGSSGQYNPGQQSRSASVAAGEWVPAPIPPRQQQDSDTLPTGSFIPPAPSYQPCFLNVSLDPPPLASHTNPNIAANIESGYYSQDYYPETTSYNTYANNYAAQSGTDHTSNLGHILERIRPDDTGAFANEQDHDASFPHSGDI